MLCATGLSDTRFSEPAFAENYVLTKIEFERVARNRCATSFEYTSVSGAVLSGNFLGLVTADGTLISTGENATIKGTNQRAPSYFPGSQSSTTISFPVGTYIFNATANITSIITIPTLVTFNMLTGDCGDVAKPAQKTSSIIGVFSVSTSGPSSDVAPDSTSAEVLALLYSGTEPSSQNQVPLNAVQVGVDGKYTFTNVPAGDYHVRFRGDSVDSERSFVSVVALEGEEVEVEEVEATQLTLDDEGCTETDTTEIINELITQNTRAKNLVARILDSANSSLDDSRKSNNFVAQRRVRLSNDTDSVGDIADRVLASGFDLSAVLRSRCPEGRNCTAQSFQSTKSIFTRNAKRIRTRLRRIARISTNNTKRRNRDSLARTVRRAQRVPRSIMRLARDLPNTIFECGEAES